MAYTGEVTESDLEDHAFTMRREIGLTDAKIVVTATKEQLHRAGQEPNRGWPAYKFMNPAGDPANVAREPIFVSKNYRNLGATRGRVRGDPMEHPTLTMGIFAPRIPTPDYSAS